MAMGQPELAQPGVLVSQHYVGPGTPALPRLPMNPWSQEVQDQARFRLPPAILPVSLPNRGTSMPRTSDSMLTNLFCRVFPSFKGSLQPARRAPKAVRTRQPSQDKQPRWPALTILRISQPMHSTQTSSCAPCLPVLASRSKRATRKLPRKPSGRGGSEPWPWRCPW
jgi:hypothetical protein